MRERSARQIGENGDCPYFPSKLGDPAFRSRRLAFVTAQSLVRGQLLRALDGREDARCFADEAEAEAWLFEAEQAAEPLRRLG